jgi:hypothetical protein
MADGSQSTKSRWVYRDGDEIVVLSGAQLPDICVKCGGSAWGNKTEERYPKETDWIALYLLGLEALINAIRRRRFKVLVPFCPNCEPPDELLTPTHIAKTFVRLKGACKAFVVALPPLPDDLRARQNRSWLRRRLSWF